MKKKTYSELIHFHSFEDRLKYLQLQGAVGEYTFASHRYMNQKFYTSNEWRRTRDYVISRDNGCDLGLDGHDIVGKIFVHHINPITVKDLMTENVSDSFLDLLNPDNLITVSMDTHNIIHYGDAAKIVTKPVIRVLNDTCPWKKR
nr:MAG TPA: HNH endonuclease bacteriophage, HNH Endonuclease, DNA.52A [Caudoviricetes sp.]